MKNTFEHIDAKLRVLERIHAIVVIVGAVAVIALVTLAGLTVANAPGLIDSGYRGELKVILVNLGDEHVSISAGDRIAQLVIAPVSLGTAVEVQDLPDSDGRGEGGFGSTGR